MTLIEVKWMKQSKNIWPVHDEFKQNLNCSCFISFDINFHFCQKKKKKNTGSVWEVQKVYIQSVKT